MHARKISQPYYLSFNKIKTYLFIAKAEKIFKLKSKLICIFSRIIGNLCQSPFLKKATSKEIVNMAFVKECLQKMVEQL